MTKKNREKSKSKSRSKPAAKGSTKGGAGAASEVEPVEVSEYKGHPIITLPDGSRRGFTFGLRKARLILKYLNEVADFAEANDEKEGG